jgi:serine protease DegS
VITHINNRSVGSGVWGIQEINESRPGETVEISLIREGEKMQLEAVVEASPIPQQAQQ